eukprot:COSAG02_NODE_20256_length_841_cov_0.501348_1_plen_141_part_10
MHFTYLSANPGLFNICWIYIAIDQESDDGCSEVVPLPCTPSDARATASARRFLGTVSTLVILTAHWIGVVGPLLLEYARSNPKFLEQFEAPPSKREPDYANWQRPCTARYWCIDRQLREWRGAESNRLHDVRAANGKQAAL